MTDSANTQEFGPFRYRVLRTIEKLGKDAFGPAYIQI